MTGRCCVLDRRQIDSCHRVSVRAVVVAELSFHAVRSNIYHRGKFSRTVCMSNSWGAASGRVGKVDP